MSSPVFGVGILVAVLVSTPAIVGQNVADPAAAERQYRLAQRLAADGSQDAAAAFERAVALAPNGPLADDALVDLSRLSGAPDWPEELGGLDAAGAARARGPLEKVVAEYAGGDRTLEARYRLALIRLAPIPGRDEAAARRELISIASVPSRERWVVAARYALGLNAEQSGSPDRASGAFARIIVERPESDVAPRACAGLGRTMLVAGHFGEAAGWFQDAIEGGAAPEISASAHRDLALREVLRERVPAHRWAAVTTPLPAIATPRGASLLATGVGGRIVVFDRKRGVLQAFDATGAGAPPVPVADVTAIAADPFGRVFVATKDKLLRWDASVPAVVSTLGDLGSPSAIAVDAAGSVWIADRKGDRIARWDPGAPAPVVVREGKGPGVGALAIAGGRLIAVETKTGRIFALERSGAETAFGTATFRRPIALAVDGAGRISVLDEKAETVTRLTPSGQVSDTLALGVCGISHPVALAAAPDGAIRVLDGSTGGVAVTP